MSKSRSSDRRSSAARRPDDQQPASRDTFRRRQEPSEHLTSVRLTRKYAEMIDGVDLTEANVGDELNLPPRDADVLIAEGWAEPSPKRTPRRRADDPQWETDDHPGRKRPSRK